MPNWCNNFMQFFHNGTPEGELALKDFHDRIALAIQKSTDPYATWEADIEKEFGICIQNTLKRGYVAYLDEISNGAFYIECEDAWNANLGFWYTLIKYMYGDKLDFTYQASEPGMCYFYTNNQGLLPRYSLNIYAETKDLIRLPNVWDTSGGLFWELNRSHPNVFISPLNGRINVDDFVEGDEDEIIEHFADNYNCNCECINDIHKSLGDDIDYNLDSWEYIPLTSEDANLENVIPINKEENNNGTT